mmetsp:Transcript_6029/g.12631  ORF Transcript_6029/g.12631 Transcript_6029/m.12631 type:complete len:217 (-) Transcript_6029:978-1628(-)
MDKPSVCPNIYRLLNAATDFKIWIYLHAHDRFHIFDFLQVVNGRHGPLDEANKTDLITGKPQNRYPWRHPEFVFHVAVVVVQVGRQTQVQRVVPHAGLAHGRKVGVVLSHVHLDQTDGAVGRHLDLRVRHAPFHTKRVEDRFDVGHDFFRRMSRIVARDQPAAGVHKGLVLWGAVVGVVNCRRGGYFFVVPYGGRFVLTVFGYCVHSIFLAREKIL